MPRKFWTPEKLETLCNIYPHFSTHSVAKVLGCSKDAVCNQAYRMGLTKTAQYITQEREQRGHHQASTRGRFKPGQAPWNKGQPGSTGHHPNTRATQFKAGRPASQAANYRAIGSHRICSSDGNLYRKVTDDPSIPPVRRWVPVARLVWEAAHGPIPPGHLIVFKDKRQRTTVLEEITLDKLACISKADNARRNSYWANYPPEVARLVQLKGAINRQVNRISKESKT